MGCFIAQNKDEAAACKEEHFGYCAARNSISSRSNCNSISSSSSSRKLMLFLHPKKILDSRRSRIGHSPSSNSPTPTSSYASSTSPLISHKQQQWGRRSSSAPPRCSFESDKLNKKLHCPTRKALLCGIPSPNAVFTPDCSWRIRSSSSETTTFSSSSSSGHVQFEGKWAALNSIDLKWARECSRNAVAPLPLPLPPLSPTTPVAHPLPLPSNDKNRKALCKVGLQELETACKGFSADCRIGYGDRGGVYKCRIRYEKSADNAAAAVEALVVQFPAVQGSKDWMLDLKAASGLEHPNLCRIIGYAAEEGELQKRFVMYERLGMGTLDKILYGGRRTAVALDWSKRISILLDAARGLEYLHSHAALRQLVYYREFKTFNIALEKGSLNAKLMGYTPWRWNHSSDSANGAYAAPETLGPGTVTNKSNVWSFGLVILEILTGRQNLDGVAKNVIQLSKTLVEEEDDTKMLLRLDPEFKGLLPLHSAKAVVRLARDCVQLDPKLRPNMKQVVETLAQQQQTQQQSKLQQPQQPKLQQQQNGIIKPKLLRDVLHESSVELVKQRAKGIAPAVIVVPSISSPFVCAQQIQLR